jgi:hypothetical protein
MWRLAILALQFIFIIGVDIEQQALAHVITGEYSSVGHSRRHGPAAQSSDLPVPAHGANYPAQLLKILATDLECVLAG